MPSWRSTFASAALALGAWLTTVQVRAQACCAAASAVTPARLTLHERAIVGVELRSQGVLGSYGPRGAYSAIPDGASEVDFGASLIVGARVSRRVQLAGLLPWQETRRVTPARGELGGGFGDLNLGLRYDLVFEHEHRRVPGIALLVGTTAPTGTAPELAKKPLATDATGIGAVQLHAALALEKEFGHWLVGATGLVARRLTRSAGPFETTLGTQLTGLVNVSYLFANLAALAVSASYSDEADATVDGEVRRDTGRRALTTALSGVLPLDDRMRLQGSWFVTPPVSELGRNQNAVVGVTVAALASF
ncbi:MAG: hypothetical protein FJ096_00640 [Deltaproteobacteria bacterium]|nr:hypothetical protein [Deltaproteobacteria bacterium]